jgi:hypothetical protein
MKEEAEALRLMLRMKLGAITMVRAKLDAMERHIEDLKQSAANAAEDVLADARRRGAAMKNGASREHRYRRHSTDRRDAPVAKAADGSPLRCDSGDLGAVAERSERYALMTMQRVSRCLDEAENAMVSAVHIRMEADAMASMESGTGQPSSIE